jgi:hypothetical protein
MIAPSTPDKLWYLRRLNLFEGMSAEEVERVSQDLRMRSWTARASASTWSSRDGFACTTSVKTVKR